MIKKFSFLVFVALNVLNTQAAPTWPDQNPISIPLNPDQDRPYGRCNQNSDCGPGASCNSWGTCEY